MHDTLMVYFDGERNGGLFLAGLGAVAIVAAVLLFRAGHDLRSFAVTLGVVGVLEIALGVGLYLRTDPQVGRLVTQLEGTPAAFHAEETARMARVQRTFVAVVYVELAVILVSAFVAVALKGRPGPAGITLGLLIHASVLLAFDVIAERRGAVYFDAVRQASP